MNPGDKVIVRGNPNGKFYGSTGTIVGIDKSYFPPVTVVMDGDERVPELASLFFYEEELEVTQ